MKKYITLSFLIIISFTSFGQQKNSNSISGKIIDDLTGKPLQYATIYNKSSKMEQSQIIKVILSWKMQN
jgi:hypothetical protein